MIDFVHMKTTNLTIPEKLFKWSKWRKSEKKDGTIIWYHRFRGVWIRYYPETSCMTIRGKILMLLENSEVLNVDDIYGQDIPQFIEDINGYLNGLFYTRCIDITLFHVSRIDYCINVCTPYGREYIDFLNRAFMRTNHGQRVNYTLRNGLSGSVYIKTKSDYDKNDRRNYVLNFYDKTDRLQYQLRRGHLIGKHDIEYARGVFRLEVQCGFQFIKHLCKHFNVDRTFGSLLNYTIAYYAEAEVYNRIYRCDEGHDYCTYVEAKKRIPDKKAAKENLLKASQGHKISDHGRKLIQQAGIFPFCFLKRDGGILVLENPLKLIRCKFHDNGISV